jgi:hypothetical protein
MTLFLEGPHITAERLQRALTAFFALLDDVAEQITGDKKPIRWIVSAKEGSFGIVADPMPVRPTVPVRRIMDAIHDGAGQLQRRAKRPRSFSDTALRSMRELASVADGREVEKARMVLSRRSANVQHETATNVDRILGTRLRDYGSIEGQLQMVSIRGGPHFAVSDELTGKSIQCNVAPDQLEPALEAFTKRVAIFGLIRYGEAGDATSIEAERIDVLPDDATLPTAEDVYGILSKP